MWSACVVDDSSAVGGGAVWPCPGAAGIQPPISCGELLFFMRYAYKIPRTRACVSVRECSRVCVRACISVCARVFVRSCVCVCVCVEIYRAYLILLASLIHNRSEKKITADLHFCFFSWIAGIAIRKSCSVSFVTTPVEIF